MALITEAAREDIVALFIGMFNAAPGEAHLSSLVQAYNDGASLLTIAQTLEARPEFGQSFPGLSTAEEYAASLVDRLLGDEVEPADTAWATDWVIGQLNAGASPGAIILAAVQALRTNTNPAFADAQAALENEIDVAIYYSVTKLQPSTTLLDLQSVIAGVTSDPATVVAAKEYIDDNLAGQEFVLTIGGDTIKGNAGNDSILGNASTLSALDTIDGDAGIDTLTVLGVDAAGVAASPDLSLATVTNVEKLVVNASAGDLLGNVADVSSWGLDSATFLTKATALTTITAAATTDVNVTNSTAVGIAVVGGQDVSATNNVGGTIAVTGGTGLTSVTTNGGSTVTINDAGAETDTLTTVSLTGNAGAATIDSSKLTSLTLTNNTQDVTVTAGAGTRALNLTVNKATGGIVSDATATTVNVSSTGASSSGLTLTAVAATAVTIAADEALTIADVNLTKATTITVSGDSKVTISAATDVTALTAIDASASTSGMTITPVLGTGIAFTGGAGTDTVSVGATTKAISLGAGNDTATVTGALGAGGTLTGGDGTDTLVINVAAPFGAMTGITGFETLGLGALANGSYSAAGFTSLTHGVVAGDVTFTNVAAGTGLKITASPTKNTTYTLADNTGTADSLALTLAASGAAITTGTVTAGGVETIAVTSDDTDALTTTNINHVLTIGGNEVKTITVSGDAGLTLTATSTALTSLDASGTTNALTSVSLTTGALAAVATLSGGAGADTLIATAATKAVTLNGNGGNDTLTAVNANNNIANGGDGNDTITLGNGNNTVAGGAGNDTIVVGTGSNTITAGDGNDTITVGGATGLNTVDVGAGTDTVVLGGIQAAAGYYTSITNMSAGDMLNLVGVGALGAGALGAKVTLGAVANFANYLDAAVAGAVAGEVNWFQFAGNTYVTVDNGATTTFVDGTDTVVEIVGLIDLSASVLAAGILTG